MLPNPDPTTSPSPRLRRARRAAAALPVAALALLVLVTVPVRATPGTPEAGTLTQERLHLTGPDGLATRTIGAPRAAARPAPATARVGWSAEVPVPAGTQSIGASWTHAPHGEVEVRGQAGSSWTPWTPLGADPEDGPDRPRGGNPARDAGGVAWFGSDGVDRVQLRVTSGNLADLEVQPMRYEAPAGDDEFALGADVAGAATVGQPTILPRSMYTSKGWATQNAGCSSGPLTASGGLKFAVIHHTVNANTYAAADVPALLASIYAYHTGTQGWCDIAYNFIVDRFGRIWEGRSGGIDKAIIGGHAAGFNTGSVGVSFLGQYEPGAVPTAATPTDAALTAASQLLAWKLGTAGLDPTSTVTVTSGGSPRYPAGTVVTIPRIAGHRDTGLTACPGANLYAKIPGIRTLAKALVGTSTPTTTTTTTPPTTTTTVPVDTSAWKPFTTPETLVDQQYRDLLLRPATADEKSTWAARLQDTWTPATMIAHLSTTSEIDASRYAVIRLYRAFFLRNPDHPGLAYWLSVHESGVRLADIAERFARSAEFTNKYGALTNSAFVDLVYRNVLGRDPETAGRTYWTGVLNSGTTRGKVMATFSQSAEFVTKTLNAARVIGTYDAMLRDTIPADLYTYLTTGLDTQVTSLSRMAEFFLTRPEYAARF